jgi:hypothetical protein
MTPTSKIEIISFVAMPEKIEATLKGGLMRTLSAEKYDLAAIIEEISPKISRNQAAEINLDLFVNIPLEIEIEPEEELTSNGFVRFFKKIGAKIKSMFVNEHGEPQIEETEIKEETTVAAVTLQSGKTVEIPNVQNMKKHINHAKIHQSEQGLKNFLANVAEVIESRGHSIDDLLKFLEKNDLPITDDGHFLAYKSLLKGSGNTAGFYTDPHSKRVPQDIGTLVYMPTELVDPNRRNECSNGLHVGRRGYMGSFRADDVFIVKVNPKDVIAVPSYDASKMRLCAYHIVGKLSSAGRDLVYKNKSVTSSGYDLALLEDIIKGKHINVVHRVFITGPKGTGLIINGKPVDNGTEAKEATPAYGSAAAPLREEPVKAKKAPEPAKEKPTSRAMVVKDLMSQIVDTTISKAKRIQAAKDLVDQKKQAKVSYAKLGISPLEEETIKAAIDGKLFDAEVQAKKDISFTKGSVKAVVNIDNEKQVVKPAKKLDIKATKAKLQVITEDHKAIVAAFDAGMSYRKMEKEFKKSRRTLQKILRQYRNDI